MRDGWVGRRSVALCALLMSAAVCAAPAGAQSPEMPRLVQQDGRATLMVDGAPYFILGRQPSGPARLRVLTPWDLRRRFAFGGLEVGPASSGQPQVEWRAFFTDNHTGASKETVGHVEIRWSHGRFCGAPESKLYLDTRHEDACGYVPI